MAINPILFSKEVFEAYTDFLVNFISFRDKSLEDELKNLIRYDFTKGSSIIKGPYISLNKPFQRGKKLSEIGGVHGILTRRIKFNLYAHQEEAFKTISSGKNVIITTGTGSGKTEAFLFPIIDHLLKNPGKGIRAIIIYPMNALANDQLVRMRLLLAGTGVTFGRYTGDTPEKTSEDIVRYPPFSPIQEADKEKVVRGEILPHEERFSREEIREDPPNILITNYSQLEYLLLREQDLKLFNGADIKFIVLDEAHTYVGEQGSEVAALLRRIRILAKDPDSITFIGTSATIASGSEEEKKKAVKEFASKLFGVDESTIEVISEKYREIDLPSKTYTPYPLEDPLKILEKIVEESENGKISLETYQLLTSRRPEDMVKDILENEFFRTIIDTFSKPLRIEEALGRFKDLHPNFSDEQIIAQIYSYLITGLLLKDEEDEPLLHPRVHYFVKGINDLRVKFENGERKLLLNPEDTEGTFRVYTCRTCGQHYYSAKYTTASYEDNGVNFVTMVPENSEEGERILFTDTEEFFEYSNYKKAYLCTRCGAIHYSKVGKCLNCGSESIKQVFIPMSERENSPRCPACGTTLRSNNLVRSSSSEPMDITVLTENMLSGSENSKVIIFTDTRQEAAYLSGIMRITSRRFILRDRLYKFLKERGRKYSLRSLVDEERLDNYLYYLLDIGEIQKDVAGEKPIEEDAEKVKWFICEEFTSPIPNIKRGSLEKLGLVHVDYLGVDLREGFFIDWAKKLGVFPNAIVGFTKKALDYLRRKGGAVAMDIAFELAGSGRTNRSQRLRKLLGISEYFKLTPISKFTRRQRSRDKEYIPFVSKTGRSYLQILMQKEFGKTNNEFLESLFDYLLQKGIFLEKNGEVYLNPDKIIIGLYEFDKVLKCEKCGETVALDRETPANACVNFKCKGRMRKTTIPENYDSRKYKNVKTRIKLKPEEHSGQVGKSEREAIERSFKKGDINVLVATSTLELGIDIGDLDLILLRNVPPSPANYDQRVGRAGRRRRISVAVTYCGWSSHDKMFFNHPEEMIRGQIKTPTFSMRNEPLLRRHVHSIIFTSLLTLYTRMSDQDRELFKKALPTFIRDYFPLKDDGRVDEEALKTTTDFVRNYRILVEKYMNEVKKHVVEFFKTWRKEDINAIMAYIGVNSLEELAENFVKSSIDELNKILIHTRDMYLYWRKKADEYHADEKAYNPYNRTLSIFNDPARAEDDKDRFRFESISYLRNMGYLPGYNLVQPGVFAAREPDVQIFRPQNIAIYEFAPYSYIYIRGKRYRVKNYIIHTGMSDPKEFVIENKEGEREIVKALSMMDVELTEGESVHDDFSGRRTVYYENAGKFSKNGPHLGGFIRKYPFNNSLIFLRGAEVFLINKRALPSLWTKSREFYICPKCGAVFNIHGKKDDYNKERMLEHAKKCGFKYEGPFALYARYSTDVLYFEKFESEERAVNFIEGIKLGATLVTDISETDLNYFIAYENGYYYALLYDTVPGGSGYLEYIAKEIDRVIKEAMRYLREECKCKKACYGCLMSYWNRYYHKYLDKKVAIEELKRFSEKGLFENIPPAAPEKKIDESDIASTFEKEFLNEIKSRGFPIPELQYKVEDPRTIIDFAYPEKKIAIYIDGLAYHQNRRAKDKAIRYHLRSKGWEIVEINDNDWNDPETKRTVLEYLSTLLKNR